PRAWIRIYGNPRCAARHPRWHGTWDLRPCMDVRTIMHPDPLTLGADDTPDIADDLMRLGRIRHLPIVEGDRLVGIVSQRDLLSAAVSSLLEFGRAAEREWLRKIAVRKVMT